MKPIDPDHVQLIIDNGEESLPMREIVTIVCKSTTLRLCSVAGMTFAGDYYQGEDEEAGIPGFWRDEAKTAIGSEVQSCDLKLMHGINCMVGGQQIQAFGRARGFDGARVTFERLTWIDSADQWISSVIFDGFANKVKPLLYSTEIEVESILRILDRKYPTAVFSPKCTWIFGGDGCGIDRPLVSSAGAVGAGSDRVRIYSGIAARPAGYFDGGSLAVAGVHRPIATSSADGVLMLSVPLPSMPAVGASLTASPTCARTPEACAGWGNSSRFTGMPYIPTPETAR
jgi:hypothetical protein